MAIIVVDETKTVDAASAAPGVYGSTTMKGELLIKTHSHMDTSHPFHGGHWINLEGTYGFTPEKVHPAMTYDDPTDDEINESREAGAQINHINMAMLLPALDEEMAWILGRPNFTLIGFAKRLRELGHEIKTRSEDEQAAVIYWMLNLYLQHGADWQGEAEKILARKEAETEPA